MATVAEKNLRKYLLESPPGMDGSQILWCVAWLKCKDKSPAMAIEGGWVRLSALSALGDAR
jgi:hypothetical protein